MKKISVVITAVLLLIGYTANAHQKTQNAQDRAEKLTKEMVKSLNLNASQEEKVAAINLKYAQKNEELLSKGKDADKKSEKRDALKAAKELNEEKQKELKSVLTDEQYQQWTSKKDEKKSELKGKRKEFKNKEKAEISKVKKANE